MLSNENLEWYRENLKTTNLDPFRVAKFDGQGNVKPGWSYEQWTLQRTAAWGKRPSKGCHTVLAR